MKKVVRTLANQRGSIIGLFLIVLICFQAVFGAEKASTKWYENWEASLAFAALIVAALIVGFILGRKTSDTVNCIGFAMLGGFIGLSIGLSKSPVVGVLMPAVLTFLGSLVGYFFATKSDKGEYFTVQEIEHVKSTDSSRSSLGKYFTSFSVLMIVGSYLGISLRISSTDEIFDDLKKISEKLQGLTERIGKLETQTASTKSISELYSGIESISNEVKDLASQVKSFTFGFEGQGKTTLAKIVVNRDLSGPLKILDCAPPVTSLFAGTARQGSSWWQFGEFLEIRWSMQDGPEAISVQGWESITEGKNGWSKSSEERTLGDADRQAEGEEFVLHLPKRDRSCSGSS